VLKDTAGAELLLKIASTSVDEMGEDGGEGENGIVDPTAPWVCCIAAPERLGGPRGSAAPRVDLRSGSTIHRAT
jgi:hypothetical protein